MGELRSDIWGGNTFESPSNVYLIESQISSTVVPYDGWGGYFTLIHRLNDFILNVPDIEFNDPNEKAHMMGQVHGIRAYIYFTMLKTWGAVPITTEPLSDIDPAELAKARSPESEVMTLIKNDIQASLTFFGTDNTYWGSGRNYWSKAATLSLKGEAFIWSGTHLGGGNADYDEAKSALEDVSGLDVILWPTYTGIWENENNKEYIFAFDYAVDQATNIYGALTGRGTEIKPTFRDDGTSMQDFTTNGANRYGPSHKILLATDDPLDTRRNATFLRLYPDDNGGAGYPTYDEANYSGAIHAKFLGQIVGGARVTDSDVPLYRYADVLLMLAEAKNLLGEDPTTEMNMIIERAYGENYDAGLHGFTNGSKEENVQAILEERLKEFIGEGKRWYDLRRAGDQYVFEHVEYISQAESFKLLLPISLNMIGRNPLLEQTPGYD